MKIIEIKENKKSLLPLLLLGDEQENMIDKYLEKGRMFAVCDKKARGVCVITDEGNGVLEIKNIAVSPDYQRQGIGRALIEFIENKFGSKFSVLQLGTGDSPLTVPFYEKCGFEKSHIIKNFFTDNYDHAIFEQGKQLTDMVYFKKELKNEANTVKIDGNPIEKEAMKHFHLGNRKKGLEIQERFVAEFREEYKSKDHCPCKKACRYHGNCKECVAIHRAHREHVPNCLRPMLNDKIKALSELTEHTLANEIEPPNEILRK